MKLYNKYDYLVNDDELYEVRSDIDKLRSSLELISKSITDFRTMVETSNEWNSNGREELVNFLKLTEQLAIYIAGKNNTVSLEATGSALDNKTVEGGEDHISNLLSSLDSFLAASSTLEKGGTCHTAEILNSIQGD